jgi:hypothetical protein
MVLAIGALVAQAMLGAMLASFRSVAELKDAIHDYLDRHNADPKPFVWTKSAEIILDKERRALDALEAIKPGNQPLDSQH